MFRRLLSILFCSLLFSSGTAASLVEGRICLKNGTVIECKDNDRLQIPKKSSDLKIFRDAFLKTKRKERVPAEEIDTVLCWHVKAPQHVHRFIFVPRPGWMRIYFETPHIKACIYSKKGYDIGVNGGVASWQRNGFFSRSRVAFFLQKQGMTTYEDVGGAYRRSKDIFRERIARYIDDDPALAEHIRRSNNYRDKTVLMLRDYTPTEP